MAYSLKLNPTTGKLDLVNESSVETQDLQDVTENGAETDVESTFSSGIKTNQIKSNSSAGTAIKSNNGTAVAEFGAGGGSNWTFEGGVKLNAKTGLRILATDADKNIEILATSTYPSLDELAHLKGVTSGVQTQLNSKVPSTEKGANNGVASLDSAGKVPIGQLPATVLVDTFVVASEAAMLALSDAEQGDIAVRTDISKTFILSGSDPSILANWTELLFASTLIGYVTFNFEGLFDYSGSQASIVVNTKKYIRIPYAGTITGWTICENSPSPISGSIVIDVWKDTAGNYPPTVADSIAGTEKPTLSSQNMNDDTTLSSWTTTVNANDIIGVNVDSCSGCKNVIMTLIILKS